MNKLKTLLLTFVLINLLSFSVYALTFTNSNTSSSSTSNGSTSEQVNGSVISPISQGTYTHSNKYHSVPPYYFALARMLDTRMPIAKIQGKGEAFQLSKIEGVVETNKLFVKNQVAKYPDKERWGAKLYWDTVEIKEKVKWIHSPGDMVEDFISVDLDHDGDKDWLVFLYGFTQVKKDNSSEIYKNCEKKGCVSGDVVFPVVAFLTDENGKVQGPTDAGQFFESGNAPYVKNARMIRIADFNGDSIDDYIIAEAGWDNPPHNYRPSYQSHIFLSTGDKFKHVEFGILDKAHGITVGDIDNDGDQDFIISYVSRSVININDGKGNFKNKGTIKVGYHTNFLELADFDSDGDLDLLLGTGSCKNASSILKNNGKGSFSQWNKIKVPIKKPKKCVAAWSGGDYWDDNFAMIHHLIEFDDKLLMLTSNNHQGWGFSTLIKDGKNLRLMNSGKFKKENVSEGHFPYKVMLDEDKVTIFDFGFNPYYFEFNHETGELIQQLQGISSNNDQVKLEEQPKGIESNNDQVKFESSIKKNGKVVFEGADKFTKFDVAVPLPNSGASLVGFKNFKAPRNNKLNVRTHIKYGNIDFATWICFEYYSQHTFMAARTNFGKKDWGGLKKIMPSSLIGCKGSWELNDNKSKIKELGIYPVMTDIQENVFAILKALDDNSTIDLSKIRSLQNK